MNINTRVSYANIFGNINTKYSSLLNKIDLNRSLRIIVGFIRYENHIDIDYKNELNFILTKWLSKSSAEFKQNIIKSYHDLLKGENIDSESNRGLSSIRVINRMSSLRLIEIILTKLENNNLNEKNYLNSDENLFKIYLLINEQISKIQDKAFSPFKSSNTNIYSSIRFHLLLGLTQEAVNRQDASRILVTGVLKFILFEKWLRKNKRYNEISNDYLKIMNLNNWYEYFHDIFQINNLSIQSSTISTIHAPHLSNLLNFFSAKTEYLDGWDDFLNLRKRPIFKLNNDEFIILDLHFMLDKFFSGVYHDLIAISKEKNIKSFHQDLNKGFVEEFLLIDLMKSVFGKKYIKFSEKDIKAFTKRNISQLSLPDYYLRNGNKVLLIECKNSFLSKNSKVNLDLINLEKELMEKFYFNKNRKKAVKQLIGYIINIETGKYNFFDEFKKVKTLKYYPILVTTDHTLNSPGFNKLLNSYFQNEKENLNIVVSKRTKQLTIIHIDDFLHYTFKLEKIFNIIDKYHKYINKKSPPENMLSFSDYLNSSEKPIGDAHLKKKHVDHMLKESLLPIK